MINVNSGRAGTGHVPSAGDAAGAAKVFRVPCAEGKSRRTGGGCDEEIDSARTSSLAPAADHGGGDAPVGARRLVVERQWVKRGLCPLQSVLSARTLIGVRRRVEISAASSAMVSEVTASSTGKTAGSSFSRSMTTEVSMIPRAL
jgi:hypothetical protein